MASSVTRSLFGSFASSTSGFRFDPAAIMTLLFLAIAADGAFRESVHERSSGVAAGALNSNIRSVRGTMRSQLCHRQTDGDGGMEEDEEEVCLNGGSCISVVEQEETAQLFCSCSSGWTGDFCQYPLKTMEINLGSTRSAKLESAQTVAAISTCVLFIAAAILSTIVYFRYRRKERLLEDRLFRATAEELYRRPFNNRSSIVESLSRLNSVRRTQGTNGRDNGAKGSSTMELNIQAECHSLTSELGRDFETKLIRQPSSASRAGGTGGRAPATASTNRNELTV